MLLFTKLVLGFTILANIGLIILVLHKHSRAHLRQIFALYIAGITGWAAAIFLNLWLASPVVEYFVFAFAALFLTAQFWFAKLFPDGRFPKRIHEYWSLLIGLFFFCASFGKGALFHTISVLPNGYTVLDLGPLSIPYSLFALCYVIAPVILLIRKYRKITKPVLGTQLRYLILGFSAFAVVNVLTNSILPIFFHIFFFNAIGPVFSLFLAAFILYIISRYRFLDIRVVIQRSIVYAALLAFTIGIYLFLISLFGYVFQRTTDIAVYLSAGVTLLVGIFGTPVIERYFRRLTDPLFFKDTYSYAAAMAELTRILNRNLETTVIIRESEKTLTRILRAKHATLLFRAKADERGQEDHAHLLEEIWDNKDGTLAFKSLITVSELPYKERIITIPEMHHKFKVLEQLAKEYQAELIAPIILEEDLLGALFVGPKRSGDSYLDEDRSLLENFSSQLAVAFEKAHLYEQVATYSTSLEQKIEERTREIVTLREQEKQMLADISHGLQTPLTVLKSELGQLKDRLPESKQIGTFERSIDMISKFIYDLLTLSRLDNTEHHDHLTPIDLSEFTSELVEYTTIPAEAEGIRFIEKVTPGIHVSGEKDRLAEAIVNLFGNAMKYMGDGGTKEITTTLVQKSGKAILTISDTGIGISETDLPHLFERFYRVKNTRSNCPKGTGLGLAITKRIIERHGGTITAESILGKGTTFTIILPLSKG